MLEVVIGFFCFGFGVGFLVGRVWNSKPKFQDHTKR